jgi:soluble lytic murein transglycosylase-like protein
MMKYFKFGRLIIGFFFIFLFVGSPLYADIYMYIDKNGVIHYTNVPVESEGNSVKFLLYQKEVIREKKQFDIFDNNDFNSIDSYIFEASHYYDVSFPLIKAIIKVESDFNTMAISKKGAMGLMQIMPFNFKELSIRDPFDPWENIMGGVSYFKNMLTKFNGDLSLSLAAYNAGPNAVDKYGSIPPYPETINYVEKVLKYYSFYKKKE